MRTKMKLKVTVLAVLASCSFGVATAGEVTGLTTFSSGSKAVASQVNGNFNAVKTAVGDNNSRLGTVEADVAQISNTAGLDRGRIENLETQNSSNTTSITNLNKRAVLSQQDSNDQLAIIRGCVDPAGAVTNTFFNPTSGAGFVWRKKSTGTFEVWYNTYYSYGTAAFSGIPAVTASTHFPGAVFASVGKGDGTGGLADATSFYVRTYDAVGPSGNESAIADAPFCFIAIGSRVVF